MTKSQKTKMQQIVASLELHILDQAILDAAAAANRADRLYDVAELAMSKAEYKLAYATYRQSATRARLESAQIARAIA